MQYNMKVSNFIAVKIFKTSISDRLENCFKITDNLNSIEKSIEFRYQNPLHTIWKDINLFQNEAAKKCLVKCTQNSLHGSTTRIGRWGRGTSAKKVAKMLQKCQCKMWSSLILCSLVKGFCLRRKNKNVLKSTYDLREY